MSSQRAPFLPALHAWMMKWLRRSKTRHLWLPLASFWVIIQVIVWKEHGRAFLSSDSYHYDAPPSIRHSRLNTARQGDTSVAMLESMASRFYIYENETIPISLLHRLKRLRQRKRRQLAIDYYGMRADIEGERKILEALESHPLRTRNPEDAQVFIISAPITELLGYGNLAVFDDVFNALFDNTVFSKHRDDTHVIISQSWLAFNRKYSVYIQGLSRNYHRLRNMIVATSYDPFGCCELYNQLENDPQSHSDFASLFEEEQPVTNAFSIGLGYHHSFPIQPATYQRFEESKLFLFYHTRKGDFSYGSIRFRDMLLNETVMKSLPPSIMGFNISDEDLISTVTSSKFCLVVREDTPQSYSLSSAVRAGCIPVIISDDYQAYGGPFKSSVSTHDFAIYIDEESFLRRPVEELRKLIYLSREAIEQKLKQLSVAQRIFMMDHPQSLFVQAFVREALEARSNVLQEPSRPPIQVYNSNVTISGTHFRYRYPSTLTMGREPSNGSEPVVITGVLSTANRTDERDMIRQTWAYKNGHSVFFLVAGPWNGSLVDEFETFGDLFWIDMKEDYFGIAYKVQAFVHAVEAHVDRYDYILKTDDDSYVFLSDIKQHLQKFRPNYWGCMLSKTAPIRYNTSKWYVSTETWPDKYYPNYASGIGYAMSRNFIQCMVKHLEAMTFLRFEDVAIGIIAQICEVPCDSNGWTLTDNCAANDHNFVLHRRVSPALMVREHWKILKKERTAQWPPVSKD